MTTWEDVTTLFETVGGDGYDWSTVQIISRPHGETVQYAAYVDSGCSCSCSRMDSLESYNLTWSFDFMEARREAEKAVREGYGLNDAEKAEYLAELRYIKP